MLFKAPRISISWCMDQNSILWSTGTDQVLFTAPSHKIIVSGLQHTECIGARPGVPKQRPACHERHRTAAQTAHPMHKDNFGFRALKPLIAKLLLWAAFFALSIHMLAHRSQYALQQLSPLLAARAGKESSWTWTSCQMLSTPHTALLTDLRHLSEMCETYLCPQHTAAMLCVCAGSQVGKCDKTGPMPPHHPHHFQSVFLCLQAAAPTADSGSLTFAGSLLFRREGSFEVFVSLFTEQQRFLSISPHHRVSLQAAWQGSVRQSSQNNTCWSADPQCNQQPSSEAFFNTLGAHTICWLLDLCCPEFLTFTQANHRTRN